MSGATEAFVIPAEQIARLIPHADGMCLLAGVRRFDPQSIACSATSHRLLQNPLREQGMLHAVCGVEYAAQAMAVHGALLHGLGDRPPRGGRLAGVRSLELTVSRLDDIDADLDICATLIMGDENSMVYEFTVGDGARNLLTGKATIVLVPHPH